MYYARWKMGALSAEQIDEIREKGLTIRLALPMHGNLSVYQLKLMRHFMVLYAGDKAISRPKNNSILDWNGALEIEYATPVSAHDPHVEQGLILDLCFTQNYPENFANPAESNPFDFEVLNQLLKEGVVREEDVTRPSPDRSLSPEPIPESEPQHSSQGHQEDEPSSPSTPGSI